MEMSMTSELVKKLRELQDDTEIDCYGIRELNEICMEAADTIEELSAKVARQNMERSSHYYGGGWISVDERLPEEGEKVLVWYEYFRYGEYNCMFQTYGIGYQFGGYWGGDVNGANARCIAWMPLPLKYEPKEDKL